MSSICFIIHSSIYSIIHPSRHGLFTSTGWKKSGIQTWRDRKNNRKRWHTCQSPTIINIHQKLNQLQKELTPFPMTLPFLPFHFSAFARRALTSSSSFSSISFRILVSFHLADSFASLLGLTVFVRCCCFNLFDSSSLSYIHEM
jgi:hypothetical protein